MDEKIRKLVDVMPFGITLWQVDSEIPGRVKLVFANDQAEMESGMGYGQIIDKPMMKAPPGWEGNPYLSALVRVSRTNESETLRDVEYGDSDHPHGFFDVRIISLGDGYVGAIYENVTFKRKLETRLRQMAMEDTLTGLLNIRGFKKALREALGRAERASKMVALLFCDLDGFKEVNDQFGHDTGDLALKTVAEKLCKSVRKTDTVGRLAGDEFGVIVEGIARERDAVTVADKLIEAVSAEQIYLGGRRRVQLGVSIGIAFAVYEDEDIELLLSHGDAAMYQAKESGGNQYRFFNGHQSLI